jgi:hypothetical protein
MELIIDKSFLDAASPKEVSKIWKTYFVIMPDILFFELITTREDSRKHCFNKLPDIDSPVALLPGIGELLRYEIDTKRSCIPLSERCLKEKYRFNTRLRDGTFQFMGEVLEERDRLTTEVKDDARNFAKRCMTVHQFFPGITGIAYRELPRAVEVARRRVVCDIDFIKRIYESFLRDQNPHSRWPSPSQIEGNWAFFRWVQCQLIASLRLFSTYQARIPPNPGIRFWTNIEHCMLDTYYLIFGALGGVLASADRAVMEDFSLLCPNGILVSPVGHMRGHGKEESRQLGLGHGR